MDNPIYIFGREVFEQEIATLKNISDALDETFDAIVHEILRCTGKLILVGMGKSGHIARKMAATFSSLGTCAIALSPAECMHGDLGMIQASDLVILLSFSGESEEVIKIIPGIHHIGARMIGMTGNRNSTLARSVQIAQCFSDIQEVGPLGLAPTSSSTAFLVYGDALAVVAARLKGFDRDDFSRFHPAGSLGKMLTTRTIDLMHPISIECCLHETDSVQNAILTMLDTDTDLLPIINADGCLMGILTNGDLKKMMLDSGGSLQPIAGWIHRYPYFIDVSTMAVDALRLMVENHVHAIPVVRNDSPVGIIHQSDILKYGIVYTPSQKS
ncbi:MAG: KpsF/GutQ family sugar-phosphate isomerase [Proteobacteria bacterium]|nr:KpsF/GutQ family sugar-phosphate isomerase [Pseudomonadota bacterium]